MLCIDSTREYCDTARLENQMEEMGPMFAKTTYLEYFISCTEEQILCMSRDISLRLVSAIEGLTQMGNIEYQSNLRFPRRFFPKIKDPVFLLLAYVRPCFCRIQVPRGFRGERAH